MAKRCFYSFHYQPDVTRVAKVRNIGVIEGNSPATSNDWEEITSGSNKDQKIKSWITRQMKGKSCLIVMIGKDTANRKWINYEIIEAWNKGMGVVGIFIHNLKNLDGHQSSKGGNALYHVQHNASGKRLSAIAKAYDPPRTTSAGVYSYIATNIGDWIDEAIEIRGAN